MDMLLLFSYQINQTTNQKRKKNDNNTKENETMLSSLKKQ